MQAETIIEAFKKVKNYYEKNHYSFYYKAKSLSKSSQDTAIISCMLGGEDKQFAFTSSEAEPDLKENEYWLTYYYELPYTSSTPYRGELKNLSKDLISLLQNK